MGSPAHHCPLPVPLPHPASAEGGDTLGWQRSAGSGLSLSRQADGQHSVPVLGRPGVWLARRALWVCPAPEPSVAPQFLSEGSIHLGGGRHGEAVSLRANMQWDLRQVVHKVPRWTLRVKGSANYSQGRPSGQVPSPTGAGCLTCLSLGFLLCQQPTCLPQALTPPPTEPLALQALEPHMAPAAQHGAFSSQFAQVAGQASPP